MKKIVILCVLVVMTVHKVSAQWPVDYSDTNSNLILADAELIRAALNEHFDIIAVGGDSIKDSQVYINGIAYDALRIIGEHSSSQSGCYFIDFAEDDDSTIVLSGLVTDSTQASFWNLRARVPGNIVTNPNATKLAVTFLGTRQWLHEGIKDTYLTDSSLYILIDAIESGTTVKVVINDGLPQAGSILTGTEAAFLKINRFTGVIEKQVYLNHNENDGALGLTYFNPRSLLKVQDRFYFTSVNSLGNNFMLHVFDEELDSITTVPITIDTTASSGGYYHNEMAYGEGNNGRYIGLIPRTIPVLVDIDTYDVHYINEGSLMNDYPAPIGVALFADSAFFFFHNGYVKRVEVDNKLPSIIRRDFVTNSSTLSGQGTSTAQRNARLAGATTPMDAALINGQIKLLSKVKILNSNFTNGLWINGQQITGAQSIDNTVVYKGTMGLTIASHPGTETSFSCSNSLAPTIIHRNKRIYVVDTADVDSVDVIRTTGPSNVALVPGSGGVMNFTENTSVVVSINALLPTDLSTLFVFQESAIGIADTSDIGVEDLAGEEVFPLYPNPFVDYISIPEGYANKDYDVTIYDMSGRLVFQEHRVGDRILVDYLKAGVYVVYITNSHGTTNQKVVKY